MSTVQKKKTVLSRLPTMNPQFYIDRTLVWITDNLLVGEKEPSIWRTIMRHEQIKGLVEIAAEVWVEKASLTYGQKLSAYVYLLEIVEMLCMGAINKKAVVYQATMCALSGYLPNVGIITELMFTDAYQEEDDDTKEDSPEEYLDMSAFETYAASIKILPIHNLRYIKKRTPAVVMEFLDIISGVKQPTPEVQNEGVEENKDALE